MDAYLSTYLYLSSILLSLSLTNQYKKIIKFHSHTSHILSMNSDMWAEAGTLESADTELVHQHRRFCWTVLLWDPSSPPPPGSGSIGLVL